MAARIPAGVRLQRLLAILSWVAAEPGGAAIDDVCQRFGIAPEELVGELEMAMMVGADSPDYQDMPFEVVVEDGRVWVHLMSFRRPLRLTPAEGLTLLAAGRATLDQPGADPDGPLARALAKLGAVLGVAADEVLDVDLDRPAGAVAGVLDQAVAERRRVRLRYYTYGRDAVGDRVVEPWRVFADEGRWYLIGWSPEAAGERVFRVDRIEQAELLAETFEPPADTPEAGLRFGPDAPEATLDLEPSARWVVEAHPVREAEDLGDGRVRVRLPVSAAGWLERLLLRLGPDARLVAIDPRLGGPDLGAVAARRVLDRYTRP